jgi:predicted nucleic acid-binding protein
MPDVGILDTSVIIDLTVVPADVLPAEVSLTAITLAELVDGTHATTDPLERAKRIERLQWAEASFDALPFDVIAARSYGQICALVRSPGHQPRRRVADLMIAAIAAAARQPLYTRNPSDFSGLEAVVAVVGI